jgi:hypothetical protein
MPENSFCYFYEEMSQKKHNSSRIILISIKKKENSF